LSKENASFIETACWISICSAVLRGATRAAGAECAEYAECADGVADALPNEPAASELGARSRMSARGANGATADPVAAVARGGGPDSAPAPASVASLEALAGLLAWPGAWDTSRASLALPGERVGSIVIASGSRWF